MMLDSPLPSPACPTSLPPGWPLAADRRALHPLLRPPAPALLHAAADSPPFFSFLQPFFLLKQLRIGELVKRSEETNVKEYIEEDCTQRCKSWRDLLQINEYDLLFH
jgi:hypothetical protein